MVVVAVAVAAVVVVVTVVAVVVGEITNFNQEEQDDQTVHDGLTAGSCDADWLETWKRQ